MDMPENLADCAATPDFQQGMEDVKRYQENMTMDELMSMFIKANYNPDGTEKEMTEEHTNFWRGFLSGLKIEEAVEGEVDGIHWQLEP